MINRINNNAKNYNEALAIICEYIDPVDQYDMMDDFDDYDIGI